MSGRRRVPARRGRRGSPAPAPRRSPPAITSGMRASSIRIESASSITAAANGPMHLLVRRQRELVAQVVEPRFVGGGVGDVAAVGAPAALRRSCPAGCTPTDRPNHRVDPAHPRRRRGGRGSRSRSARARRARDRAYQTIAGTAASVLPSPVCISAILPRASASAPCSCTSNICSPSVRGGNHGGDRE